MSTLKELKTNIQKVIQKMKVSLTNKGVDVTTTSDTLNALADKIDEISQGQVPSSTVYSVDLGIYGYSEEELGKAKRQLDLCLIDIWKTPLGQDVLNSKNITYESYTNLVKNNNYVCPILMPPIKSNYDVPNGVTLSSPVFRGDINFEGIKEFSVYSLLNRSFYIQELPGGNWTSTAKNVSNLMTECNGIKEIDLNFESATSARTMFTSCLGLKKIKLTFNRLLSIEPIATSCPLLESIHIIAPKADYIYLMSYGGVDNLKKIIIETNAKIRTVELSQTYIKKVPFLLIKGITSYKILAPKITFKGCESWGSGSEENRQSVIDTLITYSYDRTLNGLNAATIQLASTTLALLTDEEITTINNKGYTLAS